MRIGMRSYWGGRCHSDTVYNCAGNRTVEALIGFRAPDTCLARHPLVFLAHNVAAGTCVCLQMQRPPD
eukprot:634762-Hanusia_phi.AAC.1